jgi:hypothetical protein
MFWSNITHRFNDFIKYKYKINSFLKYFFRLTMEIRNYAREYKYFRIYKLLFWLKYQIKIKYKKNIFFSIVITELISRKFRLFIMYWMRFVKFTIFVNFTK